MAEYVRDDFNIGFMVDIIKLYKKNELSRLFNSHEETELVTRINLLLSDIVWKNNIALLTQKKYLLYYRHDDGTYILVDDNDDIPYRAGNDEYFVILVRFADKLKNICNIINHLMNVIYKRKLLYVIEMEMLGIGIDGEAIKKVVSRLDTIIRNSDSGNLYYEHTNMLMKEIKGKKMTNDIVKRYLQQMDVISDIGLFE
jgi:hypothetical protein